MNYSVFKLLNLKTNMNNEDEELIKYRIVNKIHICYDVKKKILSLTKDRKTIVLKYGQIFKYIQNSVDDPQTYYYKMRYAIINPNGSIGDNFAVHRSNGNNWRGDLSALNYGKFSDMFHNIVLQ